MKSAFITLWLLALLASSVHALIALLGADTHPFRIAWVGALVATSSALGFFLNLMRGAQARTSRDLSWLLLSTGIGTALALYAVLKGAPYLPLAYAGLIGLGGYLAYVYWYSHFRDRDRATIEVGKPLPSFTLNALDGSLVDSNAFVGRVSLLLFYRGNWCPLCMAQIREVADRYRDLERRGVEVIMVSPQSQAHTRELAQRFDVPMRFLVDANGAAARALGIDAPGGLPLGLQAMGYASDTVLPTVILLDREGRVAWVDLTDNYRVRPEPDAFIEVIDDLGLAPNPSPSTKELP